MKRRQALAVAAVGLWLSQAAAPVAASPRFDRFEAACRAELTAAQALPASNPHRDSVWMEYLRCARRELREGLMGDEGSPVRGHLLEFTPPTGCSEVDAGVRGKAAQLRHAIEDGRDALDFRAAACRALKPRIEQAGYGVRVVNAQLREGVLEAIGRMCGGSALGTERAYPEGLDERYLAALSAKAAALEELLNHCPAPAAWTVSCRGEVESATLGRAPAACEGEISLESGAAVRTGGGRAEISFRTVTGPTASLSVGPRTEVVLGDLVDRGGRSSADVRLLLGTIRVAVADGIRANVTTGRERARADVSFDPGAGTVDFDPAGSRLSVTAEGGRVLVTGGGGSWSVKPGSPVVAVAGERR